MARQLIIVESPAKVKTIKKFLGRSFAVKASVGHVRDLPSHSLGVDESNGFTPHYVIIDKKEDVVNDLRNAAAESDVVYLAPDPDREGEAIAWHVAELIKDKAKDIKRIEFNEITEKAVREAINNPRELNSDLFDAQQARRILDRLVGYKISPLLWKTIKRGISAGRVQSVALRLIVEREIEREEFRPEEYWPFYALLKAGQPPVLKAELIKINGKKAKISNEKEAREFEKSIAGKPFVAASVERKERKRSPMPPFITSTLQQSANQRHNYSAKRTMQIAQRLYEGVELGDEGITALITYMRTDSTRIADEAMEAARTFIDENFGRDYLPAQKRMYRAKKNAQDAHEAIRPVDVSRRPEMLKQWLTAEQYNLYRLIWTRFVASQMKDARFDDATALIDCGPSQWRVKGSVMLFDGFLRIMPPSSADADVFLPPLKSGESLKVEKIMKEQKFTQPPPRYSEASLVKELESRGIGRPSTYATIISTLLDRDYAQLKDKHLAPTHLGRVVCGQLIDNFARLMDTGFTAEMEAGLDKVAEGGENWVNLLGAFAQDFNPTLEAASKNMVSVKTGIPAGLNCPDCGKPLMIKFGKAGSFLACSGYPECKFTSDFERNSAGQVEVAQAEQPQKIGTCPQCGKDLVIKKARSGGRFIACSGYPDCRYAASLPIGVPCPLCAEGEIVEKTSKKGKVFYGCNRYPQCNFASWARPVPEKCPVCGSPYLLEKKTPSGIRLACPEKSCRYSREKENEQT